MNRLHSVPTVEDIMTPEPIVLWADESVQAAARMLEENEISGAPVVDDAGCLVGVLSESDLVRARATERLWSRWPGLQVRHLMHGPAMTAGASMSVVEAAEVMEKGHVHRLVVVGDDQVTPIGVVSMSDLVRAMVGEREAETGVLDDDE